jgi:tail protein
VPILVAPPPPNVPDVALPEVFSLIWTSPAGRVTELTSFAQEASGIFVPPGITGLDLPTFTQYTDTSPVLDGEISRGFRTDARALAIPVLMYGADRATFKAMRAALFADFNPRAGAPGLLTVTETDGSSREIEAFYVGGLQGVLDDRAQTQTWMKAVIELRCPSPYFLGDEKTASFTLPEDGDWLPIFPLVVTSGTVLGELEVINTGEVDAQPVFTITGPCTAINLHNTTTGESIEIDYTVDAGEVVVIDTRAGMKSILLDGTTNLYPALDLDSVLWPLVPGLNELDFDLPGATEDTSLTFAYRERFLTAW